MPNPILIRTPEPLVQSVATLTLGSGVMYANYVGPVTEPETQHFIEVMMAGTTPGVTLTANEWGLFSSPSAPIYGTGQTLTKLVATASGGVFTSSSVTVRSADVALLTLPTLHLWAAIRVVMSTMPKMMAASGDMNCGYLLQAAAPGALTGLTTVACSLPALSTGSLQNGASQPMIRVARV